MVQVNVGTKHVGRGKRGIEIDLKELMALRNLVHYYCPNPFKSVDESRFSRDLNHDKGDDTKRLSLNESIKKINQSFFSQKNISGALSSKGIDNKEMHKAREGIFLQVKSKQIKVLDDSSDFQDS